jgi:hypothetical protein
MIDYSAYKKYYTPGGEFLLSGADYIGYVELFNGEPCEFGTRKVLTPAQTFATDVLTSKYFYDRLVNDKIALPHSLEDIAIAPNDHLNYNLIKDRLTKLHENNAYTFSRLFIPNNNIPVTDNVTFAAIKNDDDVNFTLLSAFEGNVVFESTTFFSELGNIINFVGKKNVDLFNNFAFFCITDTKFITLTSNEIETTVIEVSDKYETVENELQFKSLSGIAVNDKFLYISDTGNNVVIKYEIAGYFSNDYALANKRNFIEVVGGEGSAADFSRFKSPKEIACNNRYVAVHDSGNYSIKIFNTNFNYVKQLRGLPLRSEPLAAIEFNPNNNTLYVLTYFGDNNRELKLYVFSADFILQEQYILDIKLESKDIVRNITFSQNDSNFWYICTSARVFKKLINRPSGSLGSFQTRNLFSNNINTLYGKEYDNYRTCRTTTNKKLTSFVDETLISYLSSSTITQSISTIETEFTVLTSLSATTIDIPFIDAIEGKVVSTEVEVVSSTYEEPALYETGCLGSTYFSVEDEIPVDNYWENVPTDFDKTNYKWNVKQTEIVTYEQSVIRPLKYYRFVMYSDRELTKVQGGESTKANTQTGLVNIKLNIAWQPEFNMFEGFPEIPAGITYEIPWYNNKTHTSKIKHTGLTKGSVLGDYTVKTYADIQNNYGTLYLSGYSAFYDSVAFRANRTTAGWVPSVSGLSATKDTAYLEISLPKSISLSSIQILVSDGSISTPSYVEVLGSNNGITFTPVASASLPYISAGNYVNVDAYEDVSSIQTILTSTTVSTLVSSENLPQTIFTSFTGLSTDDTTVLYYGVTDTLTKYDFYIVDNTSTVNEIVIQSLKYNASKDSISDLDDNVIKDIKKGCRVLPCTENYDDIIIFTNGRIYFIKEANEYKSVIKSRNYTNFGLNAFTLNGDEYIQASTINKELYKVIHDIFTLKNNIVGRFSGKFDQDGIIVLDDYNYNIDYLDVTGQVDESGYLSQVDFNKYFINENEKSIIGVVNRALTNIYKLQEKLVEITQTDTQTNIIPIYNPNGCANLE